MSLRSWGLFWDGPGLVDFDHEPLCCWGCEVDAPLNTVHPNAEMWFCNPGCEKDWASRQSLENLLYKRALQRRRRQA
jgi:hypothetical protein